jgi:UDP-N-acetylglucosamine 4-epimerase
MKSSKTTKKSTSKKVKKSDVEFDITAELKSSAPNLPVSALKSTQHTWLVTGAAGFIGSNLVETLLVSGQRVIGIDNFYSGKKENLNSVLKLVGRDLARNFEFVEGDIRDRALMKREFQDVDFFVHLAAMGSVPKSIDNPEEAFSVNVDGFISVLEAARGSKKIRGGSFASSCAVYGDDETQPKVESVIGQSLSPYATSKFMNESLADVYSNVFSVPTVGLRFFNVYGKRQDPKGAYAAVIPKWMEAIQSGNPITVFGDGKNTRDFIYVEDIGKAVILAALGASKMRGPKVFNIGSGVETSLLDLIEVMEELHKQTRSHADVADKVAAEFSHVKKEKPRAGDIRYSCANVDLAKKHLNFRPHFSFAEGVAKTWIRYLQDRPTGNSQEELARVTTAQPAPMPSAAMMASYAAEEFQNDLSGGSWPREIVVFTDGACRGNPGPSSVGILVMDTKGNEVCEIGKTLGVQTNNYAEYKAVITALQVAAKNRVARITLRSDSELLIKQLNGIYAVKSDVIKPLYAEVKSLVRVFENIKFEHVRREYNKRADELANRALDL